MIHVRVTTIDALHLASQEDYLLLQRFHVIQIVVVFPKARLNLYIDNCRCPDYNIESLQFFL